MSTIVYDFVNCKKNIYRRQTAIHLDINYELRGPVNTLPKIISKLKDCRYNPKFRSRRRAMSIQGRIKMA